jgi:hypothetical protein
MGPRDQIQSFRSRYRKIRIQVYRKICALRHAALADVTRSCAGLHATVVRCGILEKTVGTASYVVGMPGETNSRRQLAVLTSIPRNRASILTELSKRKFA